MLCSTCKKLQTIVSTEAIIKCNDDRLKLARDIMCSPDPNIYFKIYPKWLHSNLTEFFMLTCVENRHNWKIQNASLWYAGGDYVKKRANDWGFKCPFSLCDMIVHGNNYSFIFNTETMVYVLEEYVQRIPGLLECLRTFVRSTSRPHEGEYNGNIFDYPASPFHILGDFLWIPDQFANAAGFKYGYRNIYGYFTATTI